MGITTDNILSAGFDSYVKKLIVIRVIRNNILSAMTFVDQAAS